MHAEYLSEYPYRLGELNTGKQNELFVARHVSPSFWKRRIDYNVDAWCRTVRCGTIDDTETGG